MLFNAVIMNFTISKFRPLCNRCIGIRVANRFQVRLRIRAWFIVRIRNIEIINNTRGGIEAKIWERANGGQI